MKQLFVVSTLYQVISLATAIDEGAIPPASGERILVLSNNALVPEVSVPFHQTPGFAAAASRFDRTVDLNELVWPRRPGQFNPRAEELYMWQRVLRSLWKLGDERVSLYVESIQVNPAVALCRIFSSALISVHSDGLMSYGPTRNPIPRDMAQRLRSLVYVDLVPGLVPQLLRENKPELVRIDRAALRRGMEELAAALPLEQTALSAVSGTPAAKQQQTGAQADAAGQPTALVLGQYLSELNILSTEEEIELHRAMLQKALDRGIRYCVFKPHPSAGPGAVTSIQAAAVELGLELHVLTSTSPAEVVMQRLQPDLVVSCFSTALMTAKYLFNIDVEAVGTGILLERLTPYENSNRIPVTVIDALLERGYTAPAEAARGGSEREAPLQQLVESVSYCMQPKTLAEARASAEAFLAEAVDTPDMRYFKRRRLTKLRLPGALPPSLPKPRHPLHKVRIVGNRLAKRFAVKRAK
ncbi:hypothetical protein D477_011316 [Arthrobacter crystallopoietes BAB-32]|uniref:Uncharacterized protein n=1 Tax=Arthrobacter crystallopoietes BAB-32 TaxID=1246476 RepID=N1UUL6_9MICC|nr:polysialyltransferase family glycosyltransferase [Arthrobacter crystallopoietes]EMY34116.1 hypothetical protein D477_011316 [Arthrobacter crystallopoietes BAB-32]